MLIKLLSSGEECKNIAIYYHRKQLPDNFLELLEQPKSLNIKFEAFSYNRKLENSGQQDQGGITLIADSVMCMPVTVNFAT